jgi:two-component system phosphate regulon sensor histidine kinase PhoR
VLKVVDTGIGISESDIPKVFQRFYVADKSRNKNISSTGLGLSIVKHIVTQMKGEISLESKLGEGSVFTVKLPLSTK